MPRVQRDVPPWEIYAEKLMHCGYGYPLWHPEPHNGIEVSIGDVGVVQNGSFIPMFNTIKGVAYGEWTLPLDFEELPQLNPQLFAEYLEYSGGGIITDARYMHGDPSNPSDFVMPGGSHAITFIRDDARSSNLARLKFVDRYVIKNLPSWYDSVTVQGDAFRREDIVFVNGFTKTKSWGVAVYSIDSPRIDVQISGNYRETWPSIHATVDHGRLSLEQRWSPDDEVREQANQCLFLHYMKVVHRPFFLQRLAAHAGQDTLPNGRNKDKDAGENILPSGKHVWSKNYDPLDTLFEYIFEHSDVEAALVCDEDLPSMNHNFEWSGDAGKVKEFLTRHMPRIEIFDKVGMISAGMAALRSYARETEYLRHDSKPAQAEPSRTEQDGSDVGAVDLEQDSGDVHHYSASKVEVVLGDMTIPDATHTYPGSHVHERWCTSIGVF
ncbi:hypothetical protein EIP91_000746 [Steccherinum ochraceum]|uniref:Uncharacterized protein n=1 Tax=Steccherinum ochraceum TaxID=92696 RepID=A0A4V2MWN2_9APHY|nr:hypothetical protein EIP91_000746 [Steccherinum ochraceum]